MAQDWCRFRWEKLRRAGAHRLPPGAGLQPRPLRRPEPLPHLWLWAWRPRQLDGNDHSGQLPFTSPGPGASASHGGHRAEHGSARSTPLPPRPPPSRPRDALSVPPQPSPSEAGSLSPRYCSFLLEASDADREERMGCQAAGLAAGLWLRSAVAARLLQLCPRLLGLRSPWRPLLTPHLLIVRALRPALCSPTRPASVAPQALGPC